MVGILDLENFNGGQADLAKDIAKVGIVDSPLYSEIPKGIPERMAERWKGHNWKYRIMPTGGVNPGFLGGSAPAEAQSYNYDSSLNHYEIFKHSYGVDGSMEDAENIEGSSEFQEQKALTYIEHRLTIEKSLFKPGQAPVQENKGTSTAGKLGSLDHWCGVENTLDMTAAGVAINDNYLRQFVKFGGTRGVPTTHIYVNDLVRDQIDEIFKDQIRRSPGSEKALVMPHYTVIKNLPYTPLLKIIYSNVVPQGEVFGVNMESLKFVYQRLTKDKPWNDGDDAVKSQVITEATLRVNNPWGVSKITGIAV